MHTRIRSRDQHVSHAGELQQGFQRPGPEQLRLQSPQHGQQIGLPAQPALRTQGRRDPGGRCRRALARQSVSNPVDKGRIQSGGIQGAGIKGADLMGAGTSGACIEGGQPDCTARPQVARIRRRHATAGPESGKVPSAVRTSSARNRSQKAPNGPRRDIPGGSPRS